VTNPWIKLSEPGLVSVRMRLDDVCAFRPQFAEALRALQPGDTFEAPNGAKATYLIIDERPDAPLVEEQPEQPEHTPYNYDGKKRRRAAFIRKWAPKFALRLTQDARTGDIAVEQAGRVFDAIERAAPPDED